MLLNDTPIGRGIIHTFCIAFILSAVAGIGLAIAGLLTKDQKKQEEDIQNSLVELQLIADFQVQ